MDIVDEIKNNPEAGAARLEREYASKLLFVAKNVCSDENEAKGLVYDTMAEAVRQVGKLSKPKSFFSWMCSILVRKHGASKRRKSEENVTFTDDLPEDSFELDSEESLYAAVDGALLRDAVAELPEKLREAVILRYFMDMPLDQIARFLSIPVGTVGSRLNLARKALTRRLAASPKKVIVLAGLLMMLLGAVAATTIAVARALSQVEDEATLNAPYSPMPRVETISSQENNQSTNQILTTSTNGEDTEMKISSKTAALVAAALVLPSGYCGVEATGGEAKIVGSYMVHTFKESGTFTVTQGGKVDVLVVAGGGGGGAARCGGGGGGAGGVVYQENLTITSGVFTVNVGAGGTGAIGKSSDESYNATQGENSSIVGFDIDVAVGGGAGGSGNWTSGQSDGGSGGGRGGVVDNNGYGSAGIAGQGFAGGGSSNGKTYTYMRAGGGGGAGGPGTKGVGGTNAATSTKGIGGIGVMNDISGEEKWYGGGGGGGGYSGLKSANGGNGGSGIVIVRYALDVKDTFDEITGGIKTRDGEYEIHTFTNSGVLKVSGCSLVDVLVVGGGGGGGAALSGGGGGGAGGVIYKENMALISGEYEIVVGEGGMGGVVNETGEGIVTESKKGASSSALGFIAKGGGRGGNTNQEGGEGASGGGAAAHTSTTVFKKLGGGARVEGQGYYGGASTNACSEGLIGVAGGGGGAGKSGASGVITNLANAGTYNYGGKGGDGVACSITGEEKWYGGGGGGGFSTQVNANEIGTVAGGKHHRLLSRKQQLSGKIHLEMELRIPDRRIYIVAAPDLHIQCLSGSRLEPVIPQIHHHRRTGSAELPEGFFRRTLKVHTGSGSQALRHRVHQFWVNDSDGRNIVRVNTYHLLLGIFVDDYVVDGNFGSSTCSSWQSESRNSLLLGVSYTFQ